MGFTDDITDSETVVKSASPQDSDPNARIIKIEWNGEVRRVRYQIGVSKINDILSETFEIKNLAKIIFTYSDPEEDIITLSTDLELCDLLTSFPDISFRFEAKRKQPKLKNLHTLQTEKALKKEQTSKDNNNGKSQKKKMNKNKNKNKNNSNANANVNVNANASINEGEKKVKDMKKIREKIASWEKKIIRLRLSLGSEGVPPKFIGAKFNTKLVTNAQLGIKGMWTLHQTPKGEILLSPLNCPNRFLRVGDKGQVQLNQGGVGNRARWQLFSSATGEQLTFSTLKRMDVVLVNKATGGRLGVVSLPNQRRAELVMVEEKHSENYSSTFFLGIVEKELKVIECLVGKLHEKRAQAKLNRKLRLGKKVGGGEEQKKGKKKMQKEQATMTEPVEQTSATSSTSSFLLVPSKE